MSRQRECKGCGAQMVGGKVSKVFCCAACRQDYERRASAALALERTRVCVTCHQDFVVKKSQADKHGHGRYCSRACATRGGAFSHLVEPGNLLKAQAARLQSIKANGTKHKSGPEHPSWQGGPAASKERRRGYERQYRRAYRAKNADQVREYARKRKQKMVGRLPRGTVLRIGDAQRWRCAACRASITDGYHMDHIMPLARGGEHAPNNIQLLCPSCNVRKSAKHPADFMRERGFLL